MLYHAGRLLIITFSFFKLTSFTECKMERNSGETKSYDSYVQYFYYIPMKPRNPSATTRNHKSPLAHFDVTTCICLHQIPYLIASQRLEKVSRTIVLGWLWIFLVDCSSKKNTGKIQNGCEPNIRIQECRL